MTNAMGTRIVSRAVTPRRCSGCPERQSKGMAAILPIGRRVRLRLRLRRAPDLPIRRRVVFEELPPDMRAGVEAVDDRIDDARRAIDDVERWMEALFGRLARGDLDRILVGDPP